MTRGAKPFFTPEQDREVAERYRTGETLRAIGASYGVTWRPVQASLERQGISRRARGDYGWQETPENTAELVRLWRKGLSVPKIARQVNTGNSTVSRVLREGGIEPRLGGQNHRFKGDQVETLATEYTAGASLNDLARKYGGTAVVIRNTLRRHGAQLRGTGVLYWTPERISWLKEQHALGRSDNAIAADLRLSQPAVSRRLRLLGLAADRARPSGPAHASWKGGRTETSGGYIRVKVIDPEDLRLTGATANGYVPEHRLVMARKLGRPLLPGETPHHKNLIRSDNTPGNLELWLTSQPSGARVTDLIEHALGLLETYMPEALVPGWQDLPRPEQLS